MSAHFFILLLGFVLGSVSLMTFPGCEYDIILEGVTRCINNSDIGSLYYEVMNNMSNHYILHIDEHYFKSLCEKRNNNSELMECINLEYDRCSIDTNLPAVTSLTICDDPRINIACLASVSRHYPELTYCIKTKIDDMLNTTTEVQEISCSSMRIVTQCQYDMLRRCDVYTADQMLTEFNSVLPPTCQSSDPVIGR